MSKLTDNHAFKHLGKQTGAETDTLDAVPWKGRHTEVVVRFHCSEFISNCPVTGQRDHAELLISYQPRQLLIETKSLKMWLRSFQERYDFNEVIIDDICLQILRQIQPIWVEVKGRFYARGGIAVEAISRRGKKNV